jgi:mRNA interferase RelE/StbE
LTTYRVVLSRTAVSQLELLESRQVKMIKYRLTELGKDPFRSRPGADIKKLKLPSTPPLFRMRIGDYRAVYFVVNKEVKVTEIIHRSKGYKWLE